MPILEKPFRKLKKSKIVFGINPWDKIKYFMYWQNIYHLESISVPDMYFHRCLNARKSLQLFWLFFCVFVFWETAKHQQSYFSIVVGLLIFFVIAGNCHFTVIPYMRAVIQWPPPLVGVCVLLSHMGQKRVSVNKPFCSGSFTPFLFMSKIQLSLSKHRDREILTLTRFVNRGGGSSVALNFCLVVGSVLVFSFLFVFVQVNLINIQVAKHLHFSRFWTGHHRWQEKWSRLVSYF